MKIRAITFFATLNNRTDSNAVANAASFLHNAREKFEQAGYTVQTLRLATAPFTQILPAAATPQQMVSFARWLETETQQHGIEYTSMGPVLAHTPATDLSPLEAIPQIIGNTESLFTSALVASSETGINLAAIQATAAAIHHIGHSTPNGFGNVRFAMLANVRAGGPFFPGSYHSGVHPAFGIATEAADLAVSALKQAKTLAQDQAELIATLNNHAARLSTLIEPLVNKYHVDFSGFDFSLAPFPHAEKSIGAAIEHLGVDAFGGHGTLFATAFLTSCLKQANFPKTGYNGIMLPVLEDTVLAARSAEETYTTNDLLLYSAVCGTGLDTVPLPGNATPAQIAGVLLDVATLSVMLNKPLTARLLPIPGLNAGDATNFAFEYFANSVVLPLKASSATSLFEKGEFVKLRAAAQK